MFFTVIGKPVRWLRSLNLTVFKKIKRVVRSTENTEKFEQVNGKVNFLIYLLEGRLKYAIPNSPNLTAKYGCKLSKGSIDGS